jgi:hypothetical protein
MYMQTHTLGGIQRKEMCGVTAWKSRVRCGTANPKMRIPAKQISIINASIEAYESPSGSK